MIYHHKEPIIQNPPIPVLDRRTLPLAELRNDFTVAELAREQMDAISFTLKRSGKIIRKISSSPPIKMRNWKPPERLSCGNNQTVEQALARRQLVAETIYILKPIAHLASLGICSNRSWKPWVLSLVMDLTSLHLYKTCSRKNALTQKQKLQLSRRCVVLLLYLLRSPFYDRHSKDVLNAFLTSMSKNVPFAGFICTPIAKYLPFWQSNYFYMWST